MRTARPAARSAGELGGGVAQRRGVGRLVTRPPEARLERERRRGRRSGRRPAAARREAAGARRLWPEPPARPARPRRSRSSRATQPPREGRAGVDGHRAPCRRPACPAARSSVRRAGRRAAASSGFSSRSLPELAAEGDEPRRARRARRGGRARARAAASAPASSSATSSRYVGRGPRSGWVTTSPRRTSRTATPARFSATRWPAARAVERLVVDLDGAHPRAAPARLDGQRVAAGDLARPQRAGDHRPGAADRERRGRRAAPADRAGPRARAAPPATRSSAASSSSGRSRPGPSTARSRRRGAARPPRRPPVRVGEVGLRDRHDAAAGRPAPRSTAACSRVCGITPSSAATTIRKRSMPVAPATIVRTNRSCPGTSTTDSRRPDGSARSA